MNVLLVILVSTVIPLISADFDALFAGHIVLKRSTDLHSKVKGHKPGTVEYGCGPNAVLCVAELGPNMVKLGCGVPTICDEARTCSATSSPGVCMGKATFLHLARENKPGGPVTGSCCQYSPPVDQHTSDSCFTVTVKDAIQQQPNSQMPPKIPAKPGDLPSRPTADGNSSPSSGALRKAVMSLFFPASAANTKQLVKGIVKTADGYTVTICTLNCQKTTTTKTYTTLQVSQENPPPPPPPVDTSNNVQQTGGSSSGGASSGNAGGSGNSGNSGGSGGSGSSGGSGNSGGSGGSGNSGNSGGSGGSGNSGGCVNSGNSGGSGNCGNSGGEGLHKGQLASHEGHTGNSGEHKQSGGSKEAAHSGGQSRTVNFGQNSGSGGLPSRLVNYGSHSAGSGSSSGSGSSGGSAGSSGNTGSGSGSSSGGSHEGAHPHAHNHHGHGTSSGSGGGGGGCFSSEMTVVTKSGVKRMEELVLGEEVLVATAENAETFQPIEWFYHQNKDATTNYITIVTKSNRTLSLTPAHLLTIVPCFPKRISLPEMDSYVNFDSVFSRKARPGHCLAAKVGDSFETDEIVSVTVSLKRGVYSPVTTQGTLVVNGFQASCYSIAESHFLQYGMHKCLLYLRDFFDPLWKLFSTTSSPTMQLEVPSILWFILEMTEVVFPSIIY